MCKVTKIDENLEFENLYNISGSQENDTKITPFEIFKRDTDQEEEIDLTYFLLAAHPKVKLGRVKNL